MGLQLVPGQGTKAVQAAAAVKRKKNDMINKHLAQYLARVINTECIGGVFLEMKMEVDF